MINSVVERREPVTKHLHEEITLHTETCLQFIDVTERIEALVAASGIDYGIVNIHTRHTTTAIIINEHEPLLLEDMKRALERIMPSRLDYLHDNFSIRTANLEPDEFQNGHAHCKALLMRTSETLNIIAGKLQLGRWQRIFFVELDRARERQLSILLLGF